jgi:hypothetical protein
MDEARQAGIDSVVANRTSLATRLHDMGDEEYAQRAAREAAYLLDVSPHLPRLVDMYA